MAFFKKLFNSHYSIESFGIIFLALAIALASVTCSIFIRSASINKTSKKNASIYTQSFAMSQTKTQGTVSGLYTDKNHTKAFLVLSFEDMSMLPSKADEYSVAISGAKSNGDVTTIKSSPHGSLYVFGQSGVIAIYLEDQNGFSSQLLQILLRSNKNLTGASGSSGYDSALIYFNPGGLASTTADFLETDNWTMFDMIEEIITRQSEISIRNGLSAYLFDMSEQQVLMKEYSDRLVDLGVSVPSTPSEIDDEIYAVAYEDVNEEHLHYTTEYGGGWINDTGDKGYQDNDDVKLYLNSSYTFSNGFDFNWQDGRVLTGYLAELSGTSNASSWEKFIARRTGAESDDTFADSIRSIKWTYDNGEEIIVSDSSSSKSSTSTTQKSQEVQNTINMLKSAWQQYYDDKKAYETEGLAALLQLELEARNSFTMYSENTDAITVIESK